MGSKIPTIPYSVQVPNQQQPANSTKVRRNPQFVNYLWSTPTSQARNMRQLYSHCFKLYPNNQCYGTIKPDRTIEFVTFREVRSMTDCVGRAILYLDLPSEADDLHGHRLRLVGICSVTRLEWEIVAIACNMFNIVLTPIPQETLVNDKLGIIKETGMETVFCSHPMAQQLAKATNLSRLRTIVLFDEPTQALSDLLKQKRIQCLSYKDIVQKGKLLPNYPYPVISPTACATICYTLGTTGRPKGVMISHINITSSMAMTKATIENAATESDVHISYIPLAHFFQRISILNNFLSGGKTVFSSGDISKFSDDLKLIRPTFIAGPNKLYHSLYSKIKEQFGKLKGCAKAVIDSAIAAKEKKLEKTGDPQHFFYDLLVAREVKKELGGRVRWMASGGGYLDPVARNFLEVVFACPIIPVYGMTENTAVNFSMKSYDPEPGHIGGPGPNTQYKLVDVPELGFMHNDHNEKGQIRSRGELYLRGPGVFIGYFRQPQRTKLVKDKHGWLHTGDLAQILPHNGALRFMGRKQNAFRLSTGQVIIPESIEQILFKCELFEQICVIGNEKQKFVVAIIVPRKYIIEQIAEQKTYVGSYEQLCQNMSVRKEFVERLHELALALKPFEIPGNVWLQPKSFKERGVVSQVLLLQRHVLKEVYAKEIQQMYVQGKISKEMLHISIQM